MDGLTQPKQQERSDRSRSHAPPRSLRWLVRVSCIGALAGCAGSHESERAYATPNTEPGGGEAPKPTAADPRPEHVSRESPKLVSESDAKAARSETLEEAEADRRDGDMREAVEGPATARGRAADNSAQNERDRSGTIATPVEQNDEASDLELTAKIRRAIVADSSLSFDAKNVKIISEHGQVTLRGPVENAAEKARVESLARQAGTGRVVSLLEIKQ